MAPTQAPGYAYVFAAGASVDWIKAGYSEVRSSVAVAVTAWGGAPEVSEFFDWAGPLIARGEVVEADLSDFHSVMEGLEPLLEELREEGVRPYVNLTTPHQPASMALYAAATFFGGRALCVAPGPGGSVRIVRVPVLPPRELPEEAVQILEALEELGGSAFLGDLGQLVEFRERGARDRRRSRASNANYYVKTYLRPMGLVLVERVGKRHRVSITEEGRDVLARRALYGFPPSRAASRRAEAVPLR
ncbi:MAG: hypothetical protein DRO06_03475 [Thermoproteota archaeon]|nr:MAG: hypothetical protein DRO06_03475 [Candidatus Korarchaeota archaeon]